MNIENKYIEIVKKIKEHHGEVVCIEALWDGDTNGWFIRLSAIMKIKSFFRSKFEDIYLGAISEGGDIRLFNGKVPPWPESEIAKQLGNRLALEFDIEFYFPSPDDPDDSCPEWRKKHRRLW